MVDTENLRTASLYINNQLLSRGLLRDGHTIDFANTGKENVDTESTTGRIISVVNDLILRRDKDAEHRESLSTAMRTLRAENTKQTSDIARLAEKNAEAQRKLEIAESSESSAKIQVKSAEAAIRGLKEDLARTKAQVAQARASCATEIRRRDRQIDTLKKQLGEAGRSRGARTNPAITTIHVAGDVGEDKPLSTQAGTTGTEKYSLRNETNSFLAKLSQELSQENEALVKVMQRAMAQLREMSEWNGSEAETPQVAKQPGCEELAAELESVMGHMRNILTNPSFVPIEEVMVREEEINRLKSGWVKMETRWADAVHLIDGWRKRMGASGGKPICGDDLDQMGLRLSPVRIRDEEGTSEAFNYGLSPLREECEEDAEEMRPSPRLPSQKLLFADAVDKREKEVSLENENIGHAAAPEDDADEVDLVHQLSVDSSPGSSPLPPPPELSPLRNSASAGNRGLDKNDKVRQKPRGFTTILEGRTQELAAVDTVSSIRAHPPPQTFSLVSRPRRASGKVELGTGRMRSPSRSSLDYALLSEAKIDSDVQADDGFLMKPVDDAVGASESEDSEADVELEVERNPRRTAGSLLPVANWAEPAPQQSPLTMTNIAAKLAASEREADAARVRAKLRAARSASGVKRPVPVIPEPSESQSRADKNSSRNQSRAEARDSGYADVEGDPIKRESVTRSEEQELKPEKRKRDMKTRKATSRRRSTLSPWELETLIAGNAQ